MRVALQNANEFQRGKLCAAWSTDLFEQRDQFLPIIGGQRVEQHGVVLFGQIFHHLAGLPARGGQFVDIVGGMRDFRAGMQRGNHRA